MFDEDTGLPVAVMGGTYLTAIRTAMTAALAARSLARRIASDALDRSRIFVESGAATLPPPAGAVELQWRDPASLVEVGAVFSGPSMGILRRIAASDLDELRGDVKLAAMAAPTWCSQKAARSAAVQAVGRNEKVVG